MNQHFTSVQLIQFYFFKKAHRCVFCIKDGLSHQIWENVRINTSNKCPWNSSCNTVILLYCATAGISWISSGYHWPAVDTILTKQVKLMSLKFTITCFFFYCCMWRCEDKPANKPPSVDLPDNKPVTLTWTHTKIHVVTKSAASVWRYPYLCRAGDLGDQEILRHSPQPRISLCAAFI